MVQVEFRPQAGQEFEDLDEVVTARVLKKLRWLAGNFHSIKPEPLAGPLAGISKLCVGDYRVIYQPDREKKALIVRMLGHRREIDDRST